MARKERDDLRLERRRQIKQRLYIVIFETDSAGGRLFDLMLLLTIVASVLVVMLDSVNAVRQRYSSLLLAFEILFTALFSLEFLLRVYATPRRREYLGSFFGLIDIVAIVPAYLVIFVPGLQYLRVIRLIRLIRIFRILKLGRYVAEASSLVVALKASRYKITVFLLTVLNIVVIMGTTLYLLEGPERGFTSIPKSVYWAIVTLTTVGYGDIAPSTVLGQAIASLIMIAGYAIIAIPTGIITAELSKGRRADRNHGTAPFCPSCGKSGHESDAHYCKHCGGKLA